MAVLPAKTVALGNPQSSTHQIDPIQLANWMEQYEAMAGTNGALSYIDGSLSDLQARTGTSDGEYGLVVNTDAEAGVYELVSGTWTKRADIPSIFTESLAADEAEAARDKAEQWAEEDEDVAVETGKFSAKHHSIKAQYAQSAAETAESGAETARTQAELAAMAAGATLYDTLSAGETATSDGDVFLVATTPGVQVYRSDTGSGTLLGYLGEVLFDDVSALLAWDPDTYPATGLLVRTRAEGFPYQVAASGASDHHRTTAGGVKLKVAPSNEISVTAFNAVGDDSTDNAAAFEAISAYILETPPGTLYIPEGTYRTSSPLKNSRGVNVVGQGQVNLVSVSSNRAYVVSGGRTMPLPAAAFSEGDTSITFASDPGVQAGDVVRIQSSLSTNSSGANDIWRFKDWLKVESVSGNTVNFATPARYSQDPSDDMNVTQVLCVGGSTENITIPTTSPPFSGPYPWAVHDAYQHTFRNFKCTNSASYVAFSDLIQFDNCELQGWDSGASTARGTGRVSYRDCILRTGPTQPNGNAQFIEETPDRVYMENCDFFGALSVGASSDATPPKQAIVRGGRIFAPGVAVRQIGFYNADAYALDMEGVTIYAPGGNTSTYTGPDTVIAIAFANSTRVFNCNFIGVDPANYLIAASSIGGYRLMWHGNRADGGLGIHSTLDAASGSQAAHEFGGLVAAVGVRFPAAQTSNSDPNTLDDYEEGVFTPDIALDGTDFASKATSGAGSYTKIGRVVYFTVYMRWDSITVGSGSGTFVITGLPFVAKTDTAANGRPRDQFSVCIGDSDGPNTSNNNVPVGGLIFGGESQIRLRKQATINETYTWITEADCSSSSGTRVIELSGYYETA